MTQDIREKLAEALGVGVEDVDQSPLFAELTYEALLGKEGVVRIGNLWLCSTEDGEVGVWIGEPSADPWERNWECVVSGFTVTEALENMASRASVYNNLRQAS